jgi:glycosyltransferase involved in cell wall biosynthesis
MAATRVLALALGKSNAGVAIYAGEILNCLAKDANLEVMIAISTQYDWSKHSGQLKLTKIKTYATNMGFLFSSLFRYPVVLFKIFWRLLFKKYDCLYLPYFHHWDLGFILLFKLFNKKIIYTVHDGILHYGEEDHLTQWLMLSSIRRASELVFLSNYVLNLLRDKVSFSGSTTVIPHGLIHLDHVYCAKKYNYPPTLLFVGRISKYKGVERLIAAVLQLNPDKYTKLIIAGKSNYQFQKIIHDKIEIIDKYLTESEISQLLNQADIMIMPYLEASQSGVATLAIDAAIPVISTQVGGLAEQLGNGALYVAPNSPEALVDAINKLISDTDSFHRLQINLLQIKKTLCWEQISSLILDVINAN